MAEPEQVPGTAPAENPSVDPIDIETWPNVPIIPIDQETYAPHARRHELTGDDQFHPSVQNNGVQLNRFRTLNFTTGLVATGDSVNRRYNIGLAAAVPVFSGASRYSTASRNSGGVLVYDVTRFDTGGYFFVGQTANLFAPTAGYYLCGVNLFFGSGGGTTVNDCYLYHNGTGAQIGRANGSANYFSISGIRYFAAGESVSVYTSSSLGASNQVVATSEMWMTRLGS